MITAVGLRGVPACVERCLAPLCAGPGADAAADFARPPGTPARAVLPGVIMLALDGLALHVAADTLAHAELAPMRSTFPSTSATAWLTSVTGLDASGHGAVGTICREPGTDRLVNVITGSGMGTESVVLANPTLFDAARTLGADAVALGPELVTLQGSWVKALLHGATLWTTDRDNETHARTVSEIVERTVREVEAVIARPRMDPLLLWAYVNLDDHIHASGYDAQLRAAVRSLDEAACRWADRGWTVLAHADHGQVPVSRDERLAQRWDALDDPRHCRAPSGGAGRVRWLHPRPGHEKRLADDVRAALGEDAFVFTPDELDDRGLMHVTPLVRARIGEVVAVAASPRFPVPDPSLAYEHGSVTEDETLVPFAAWGAPAPELTATASTAIPTRLPA